LLGHSDFAELAFSFVWPNDDIEISAFRALKDGVLVNLVEVDSEFDGFHGVFLVGVR
jgi:hypothetical protein